MPNFMSYAVIIALVAALLLYAAYLDKVTIYMITCYNDKGVKLFSETSKTSPMAYRHKGHTCVATQP